MATALVPHLGRLLLITNAAFTIRVCDPIDQQHLLRESTRNQMFDWCYKNCEGRFWITMGSGQFELAQDATLFALRWS